MPQGSVLGPLLWNVMYDGVLRLEFDPDTHIIGCAFRTISDEAALVIAGLMPIAEQVTMAEGIFSRREETSNAPSRQAERSSQWHGCLARWQSRCDASTKGRWTWKLIPNIEAWRHGQVNFYLTQILSGHGCIRSYLKRFGHDTTC
ncbi:uncharacterized protein Dwil_GK27909 [Drosophila willistoni]|uniref:Reverse transcriptase domain-containing protein n=1 Tax=Drosophila willistoni TaxID=7260 RepID=A0A0Q9WZ42_DROWI|nr:uncharacterized protein LOC124462092 [Drosophila willistoni]KRF97432.1 uncharacterized protein Dwil_GK27909 [Drosophila willistoni]